MKAETLAESELLARLTERGTIQLGSGSLPARGPAPDGSALLRAEFLRDILINKLDTVDPYGLDIEGAYIEGVLDLNGTKIQRRLCFRQCRFSGSIELVDASTLSVFMFGSHCKNIEAERATIKGNFHLSDEFQAEYGVTLKTSTLEGDLQFRGVDLYCAENPFSLDLTGTKIKGSLIATYGEAIPHQHSDEQPAPEDKRPEDTDSATQQCSAFHGPVRGYGLSVSHNVELHGVQIHARSSALPSDRDARNELEADVDRYSLNLENAKIAEALLIRNGTRINSGIRLMSASIGTVEFNQTAFYAPPRLDARPALPAIDLLLCRVNHRLKIDNKTLWKGGALRLNQASTKIFDLDPGTWWDAPEDTFNEEYELDGFTYDRFAESTRHVGQDALNWLKGQTQSDPDGYSTQPWTQAAKVLSAIGLEVDARNVRVEGARRHARAETRQRWVATRTRFQDHSFWRAAPMALLDVPRNLAHWVFAKLYDVLIQYGHNPLRAGLWLAVCVALGAILLDQNAASFVEAKKGTSPPFDPIMMALDLFIPVVKMGWDGAWVPDAKASSANWLWYFIAGFRSLGWIVAGFAVAGFSGLARK